jgi:hypothetical protein
MLFKYLSWRSATTAIASLLLTACLGSVSHIPKTEIAPPQVAPVVRAPAVGQQWIYEVRNVFNGELVDILTETVVSVGPKVQITREGKKLGKLPDEIQEPWGMILQDPHWTPPQRFTKVVPLWPQELKPGWSGFYRTRYQVLGVPDNDFYWGLTIQANAWNRIKTQAGEFDALYYVSTADNFQSDDWFRLASNRCDQIWFAPEIGRWVARESSGSYQIQGQIGAVLLENSTAWQLRSWK